MRRMWAIFCDEVRQEANGKLIIIGVYGDVLFVPAFPFSLSRLCVIVSVETPATQPFEELRVIVSRGDDVLGEIVIPKEGLANPQESAGLDLSPAKDHYLQLKTVFNFEGVSFEAPSVLRARAVCENGEELRAMSLSVLKAPGVA